MENDVSLKRFSPHRLVGSYLLAGNLWIYASDTLLEWILPDPALLVQASVFKGFLFMGFTAFLLYALIRGHLAHIDLFTRRVRAGEERFQTIFNNMSEALFIIEPAGRRIVAINDAVCRIFNRPREEVIGQSIAEFCHGGDPCSGLTFEERTTRCLAGEMQFFTWRCLGQDNHTLWTEVCMRGATIEDEQQLVVTVRDITERKLAEQRIARLALQDPLTNLANRSGLHEGFSLLLGRALGSQKPLAVIFIDLDRFKTINDSLGHHLGDRLLFEVAGRLKSALDPGDLVARPGGDEFVVVLSQAGSYAEVAQVAEKLAQTICQPFLINGCELLTTPSIGISMFPDDGDSAETLLKHADAAMYHAKALGRNNYQFFTPQMHQAAQQRLELEKDLRLALGRGELELYYQPQILATTGEVVGVEALVRWRHPRHGILAPDRFIALAEETGLILELGGKVLELACNQLAVWVAERIAPPRVAVNLSARQLNQQLPELVASTLARAGISPQQLELEITESAAMEDPAQAIATLGRLREMGVKLAIDDFGTGYSSLGYLKLFPIDRLKIDRSFVRDIGTTLDDGSIVSAIIALAHTLGRDVVAEGVETEAQLDFLLNRGCQNMQGYLFSLPLPAAQARAFLQKRLLSRPPAPLFALSAAPAFA